MRCSHFVALGGLAVSPPERLAFTLTFAVLASLVGFVPDEATAQQPPGEQRRSFQARVDLVVIHVAVFDQTGVPVDDLASTDFEIFDDGQAQEIAVFLTPRTVPLTLVLALDFSESIRPAAPGAREAAATFLRALSPQDCVCVMPFQSRVAGGLWTSGAHPGIGDLLDEIPFEGGTALYDAISVGFAKLDGIATGSSEHAHAETTETDCEGPLRRTNADDTPGRRRALVVLTDGSDQDSTTEYADVLSLAREAGVPLFFVAIGGAADPYWQGSNVARILDNKRRGEQLEELAQVSGGLMIRTEGRERVHAAYDEVLNALRASYLIAYHAPESISSGREGSEWHDIRVTVSRPGMRVHARPGYGADSGADRRASGRQ